ncbi:hypothetical protein INR49_004863, partial [Caranx melampygus]
MSQTERKQSVYPNQTVPVQVKHAETTEVRCCSQSVFDDVTLHHDAPLTSANQVAAVSSGY